MKTQVVDWSTLWHAQRVEASRKFGVWGGRWIVPAPFTEDSVVIGPYKEPRNDRPA